MTKRKGLLDVEVDVRGLLDGLTETSSNASKAKIKQPEVVTTRC